MRKMLLILLIIVISVILIIASLIKGKTKPEFQFDTIVKRTIQETVEASGTINPVKNVSIGSQVSGMISEIYVDFNSQVKKGQLLAQIDPSLFQAQVEKAQGDLNAAISNYDKVNAMLIYNKKNYLRYKSLYEKKYVSKSDMELAKATYESDLAELKAMKAQINQAKATLQNNLTNLGYTKIVSPVDGVVVSRNVDIGQTVASSFQTPELFKVAQDLTKMQIEVNVSEADIGKIRSGQEVDYTLDGYNDKIFNGKVSQVRISPTTVSNVVTYSVIVDVNNDEQKLKPGMTANVSIITKKAKNVLSLNNNTLSFSFKDIDDKTLNNKKYDKRGIWILENNKPKRINVELGAQDSEFTEIISNQIYEGLKVISSQNLKGKSKNITSEHKRQGPPMRMF